MYEALIEEDMARRRLEELRFCRKLLHIFKHFEPKAPALLASCEVKIKALEKRLSDGSLFPWSVPDDNVNEQYQ